MSQTDMNVANDTGAAVRADLNQHLDALVTNNSGTPEPVIFANMWWADTSEGILKRRHPTLLKWIDVMGLDGGVGLQPSFDLGNLNSSTTLHISDGIIQHGIMTSSFTLTAPDDAQEGHLNFELAMDGTGGYTLTLSGFSLISGTFDNAANAVNFLRITKLKTNTYLEIMQV